MNYVGTALGIPDPVSVLIVGELERIGNTPDVPYAAGFKLVATLISITSISPPLLLPSPPLSYHSLTGQPLSTFHKPAPEPSPLSPEDETALMDRFAEACTRVVSPLLLLPLLLLLFLLLFTTLLALFF